jgi:formate dehydrogenase major subunit
MAHLGGATLDNEENYLLKKLFCSLGHRPDRKPGPYLTLLHGSRSGSLVRKRRGHHALQDLANADCILIEGSNMAECHPVGFRWVMLAKQRGATIIHVDPRFTARARSQTFTRLFVQAAISRF